MKLSKLFFLALTFPVACSSVESITGNDPIVDTKGIDLAMYDADLSDCRAYADQVQIDNKVATGAATGAVVGGVFGAVVGNSGTAKRGAGVGAVGGAVSGVSSGLNERKRVIRSCLNGRGYHVLN